jgi:uncharacterized protein YcbK (DUF882 family)
VAINRYFQRSEFACRCGCGANTVDAELLDLLTKIREYFGKPVTINSGMRCEAHNRMVGGRINSYHLRGQAADIVVRGVPPVEVAEFIESMGSLRYGIGIYRGFTHIDVRRNRMKWESA